jgi:aspartate ammonia-lyase
MVARRNRRINSSVFPQNIEPVMTSIVPMVCFMRGRF